MREQAKKAKADKVLEDINRNQEHYAQHVLKPKEEIQKKRNSQVSRENENYKNQINQRKVAEEENKKANYRNHGEWLK